MKKLKSIEIVSVDVSGGEIVFLLSDGRRTTGDDQGALDILQHDLRLLLDRRRNQRQASRDYTKELQKQRKKVVKK